MRCAQQLIGSTEEGVVDVTRDFRYEMLLVFHVANCRLTYMKRKESCILKQWDLLRNHRATHDAIFCLSSK